MKKLLVDTKVRLLFDEKVTAFIKTMIETGAVDMGPLPLKHSAEASVAAVSSRAFPHSLRHRSMNF